MASNDDWLSSQRWIMKLLHRNEERIQINVEYETSHRMIVELQESGRNITSGRRFSRLSRDFLRDHAKQFSAKLVTGQEDDVAAAETLQSNIGASTCDLPTSAAAWMQLA